MDEDFFSSDDDLGIPNDTLDELEQNAISSTQLAQVQNVRTQARFQPPRPRGAVQPPPVRRQAHNASSLNRAGINRNPQYRAPGRSPSVTVQAQPVQPRAPSAPPPSAPDPSSSDYGLDDEEVIDLDEPSMVIQPASGLAHRPYPAANVHADDELEASTAAAFAAADAELGSQTFGRWQRAPPTRTQPPAGTSMDVSALQARIAELEAEQARLRHAEQQAREEARRKQGEISIVRSNQEKVTRQYEARISVMQKLHADEAAKQKAELEAQRKEREKMETDNRFLHHDLAQEADRARRVNGTAKSRVGTQMGTPRKSKRSGLGDGFDDDEVRLVSPSKSKDKTRDQTPKVGAKRKRTANDSPVAALSFNQQRPLSVRHESSEQTTISESAPVETIVKKDGRYDYMQLLLNHRPYEGHPRTVESLAKYTFPSHPDQSLSSIFLDKMTYAADIIDERQLPLKVCQILLDLWRKCTEDFSLETFTPFYLILDMLRFVLRTELAATTSDLLEEAIPLCVKSIEQISIPITRAAANPIFANQVDRKAINKLADLIDVDEVLDFLHDICQAATLSAPRIETFWQRMDHTWMLNLLHKSLPASQVTTMLQILKTSVFPTTFGVIIPGNVEKQREQERHIVERLTNMLFEVPTPWAGDGEDEEPPYSEAEITELRIVVLEVFHAMCQTNHGGSVLAEHRSVIGRLARYLNLQLNKLYLSVLEDETHELQVKSVNLSVRVLYHILSVHGEDVDLGMKLRAVLGGYHKFLISMTRVAFSDCLLYERGIEEVVMEAAHGILDYVLGPEEGEMVMRAVETPRGSRSGAGLEGGEGREVVMNEG